MFLKKRGFWTNPTGVSSIELALILPILIIVLGGMYELTMYALVQSKIQRVASSIADLISRQPTTQQNAQAILNTAAVTTKPLKFNTFGSAIVTHVSNVGQTNDATKMTINWQLKTGTASSKLGTPGNKPQNMPGGLTALGAEEYIICEIFYTYVPTIPAPFLSNQYPIYKIVSYSIRGDTMVTFLGS